MPPRICLLFTAVVLAAPSGVAAQNPVADFLKKVDRLAKKVGCPAGNAACNEKAKTKTAEPGGSGAGGSLPALAATFEVTPLAPASTLYDVVAVSEDGARAAGVVAKGSRFAVMVDGREGPVFDEIQKGVGATGYHPPVVFGPGGRSVAYVAKRDGKAIAVVNGQEGPPFDQIAAEMNQGPAQGRVFYFSQGGDRVAYVGVTGLASAQVVVDGVAGSAYQTVRGVMFAGARLAFAAQKGRKSVVVIDGKEGPEFDGVSPLQGNGDGHVAYVGMRGMTWSVVVDGVEITTHQRPADEFHPMGFVLAPSGSRVAYVALGRGQGSQADQQQTLYVDGKPLRTAVGFQDIVFSPDGARLAVAFSETLSGGVKVMCDDWTSLAYRSIAGLARLPHESAGLQFSPDGKRFAFIATNGQKSFAVVDREESDGYAAIRNFRFSPDSRRYAFEAFTGNVGPAVGWFAVVDGKPGPLLREVTEGSLTFSPDGSRVAYAGHKSVMEAVAYIDGVEHKTPVGSFSPRQGKPQLWGRDLKRHFVFSADGRRLAYVGQLVNGKGQTVAIVDGQSHGPGHAMSNPTFSPDGRRFAHVAWFNQKWHLRVDGRSTELDGDLFEIPRGLTFQPDGTLRMLVTKDGMLNKVVVALP